MIRITIYRDKSGSYTGFDTSGHAGYGPEGSDIICAGVSALTVTAVNALEALTSDAIRVTQSDGWVSCRMQKPLSEGGRLLVDAMILGLQGIEETYGRRFVQVMFKEV